MMVMSFSLRRASSLIPTLKYPDNPIELLCDDPQKAHADKHDRDKTKLLPWS